ncbi:PH domain-containing protein [Streptomonospora salina]|uniref:Membrane protein YdbS with pleckstrin-like domain n=1 Tax=Streptomonospora salina TaxID=104205 RepID=A0A841EKE8_9ACTN|nr:PH domain-containing protein [Streptomonospora salina]MBB5999891.1 membrane protein YdbS with pleckstrin-like domain [Streptomonospora salina]
MTESRTPVPRSRGAPSPESPRTATIRLRPPANRVERRAIAWWAMRAAVFALIPCGAAGIAYAVVEQAREWLGPPLVVAVATGILLTAVTPWIRYAVHRWETTEEAVYARSGWWVREWRAAPISRIQTVDTLRGPFAQLLGLSTLVVTTASARGAVRIGGLDTAVADEEAERLTEITRRTPGDRT